MCIVTITTALQSVATVHADGHKDDNDDKSPRVRDGNDADHHDDDDGPAVEEREAKGVGTECETVGQLNQWTSAWRR